LMKDRVEADPHSAQMREKLQGCLCLAVRLGLV
jgi:hypothetical protein